MTLIVDRSCSWSVPDVVGLTLDEAEDALERADAPYRVSSSTGERPILASRWEVCEQAPDAGPTSRRVELVVARSCSIPDVEWSSLAEADRVLDRVDIDYETVTVDGRVPVRRSLWTVCDQEPAAGARASFVTLYVAHDCWADWWDRQ